MQSDRPGVWGRDRLIRVPEDIVVRASHGQLLTFIGLAMHCDDNGRCYPSHEAVAAAMSINRTTVKRSIKWLDIVRAITIEPVYDRGNRRSSNVYVIPSQVRRPSKKNKSVTEKKATGFERQFCPHDNFVGECFACEQSMGVDGPPRQDYGDGWDYTPMGVDRPPSEQEVDGGAPVHLMGVRESFDGGAAMGVDRPPKEPFVEEPVGKNSNLGPLAGRGLAGEAENPRTARVEEENDQLALRRAARAHDRVLPGMPEPPEPRPRSEMPCSRCGQPRGAWADSRPATYTVAVCKPCYSELNREKRARQKARKSA